MNALRLGASRNGFRLALETLDVGLAQQKSKEALFRSNNFPMMRQRCAHKSKAPEPPSGYKFQDLPEGYQSRGSSYSNFGPPVRIHPHRWYFYQNMACIGFGCAMVYTIFDEDDEYTIEVPLGPCENKPFQDRGAA